MVLKLLLVGVLILALILVGLSVYTLMLSVSNKKLESQVKQTKDKITQLQDVESKQVYLLSKLESFDTLLKLQEKHQAIAETIFALVPDGTTLKGFNVNQDIIVLSGSTPNWQTLNELLSRIKKQELIQLPIIKAEVNRISFGAKGEISFEINLTLKTVKES